MGELVTTPQYGDDCGFCTPGTFPAGKTPKKMIAFFTGITKCPVAPSANPPEGSYVIEQNAVTPCLFENTDFNILWQAFAADTWFKADSPGGIWFEDLKAGVCQNFADNHIVACGPPLLDGALGTCQISMEPIEAVPWLLCDEYELVPVEDTWFNQWLSDSAFPPDKVIGLYNTKYSTNCLVKYES